MFIINHVAQSPGTASHSYQGMVGTLPETEFPDASQGRKQSQACYNGLYTVSKVALTFYFEFIELDFHICVQ